MPKFVSPPERLLRSAISSTSNFSRSFLATAETASPSTYRAAYCAELNKPLVIKNIYDSKQLGKNEVKYRLY